MQFQVNGLGRGFALFSEATHGRQLMEPWPKGIPDTRLDYRSLPGYTHDALPVTNTIFFFISRY